MSGFHALNIESDDESEIEVDDTKELQIEDALKLYQTALRYHAEGPESFDKAAEAYQELFASEIFTYPESLPELQRIELYGPLVDDETWPSEVEARTTVAKSSFDSGPSTLPQILHLSHKNYAQFRLEHLSAKLEAVNVTLSQIFADATVALNHFVHALDSDETDLDLWRKTAAVGDMLNSKRVARFCLEAVLEEDDAGLSVVLSLPGLEDGLAGEQLRGLVADLDDRLSMLQGPLSASKRRLLSKALKRRLGVFEDVTQREKQLLAEEGLPRWTWQQPERTVLRAPITWAEMGMVLMKQLEAEQFGTSSIAPAAALAFDKDGVSQAVAGTVALQPDTRQQPHGKESIWPTTLEEQFPGLDEGRPTAQPQIASAHGETRSHGSDPASASTVESSTVTLVTRKRSADAAGLPDTTEEGRTKSKRTRARDSNMDPTDNRQALLDANTRWEHEQQLNEFQAADDWMFETVGNLFERIGVIGFGRARHVRQELQSAAEDPVTTMADSEPQKDGLEQARLDIADFLTEYNDQLGKLLLQKDDTTLFGSDLAAVGLGGPTGNIAQSKTASKAPPMPNDGLSLLLDSVNDRWLLTHEVVHEWLSRLLRPTDEHHRNSYECYLWSEDLKKMVVQALVHFDTSFCAKVANEIHQLSCKLDNATELTDADVHRVRSLASMIQSIFEIHLDVYVTIQHPKSLVGGDVVTIQGDRLPRWADLAREAMRLRTIVHGHGDLKEPLNLRFLWTITSMVGEDSTVSQDHTIECMNDLRAVFVAAGEPTIQLQNNAVMPELSVDILDRKISEITTSDFFSKVMVEDGGEPIAVIERLEPLLNALDNVDSAHADGDDMEIGEGSLPAGVHSELVHLLQNSELSSRLPLWQRLRDAYSAVGYKPMVVSCHFRMMRMRLDDLRNPTNSIPSQHERQVVVLDAFRTLGSTIQNVLSIVQASDDAFECIDETQLTAAVGTLGDMLELVQVFNVCEDSLRVGKTQPPMLANGMPVASFAKINRMVHELQLSIWMLLYALLKEAIYQNSELYPGFVEDKFDFLRCVHRNLGLRGICGGSNRAFVRMVKDEIQNMTHLEGYDSEQAQVMYDLHGLNCFLNPSYELIEHHCTHDAFLERGVAMQAVDLLLAQAAKLPMRDLVKHSLKDTIEKVHGQVVRKKPTDAVIRNREIYRSFLRSPINPLDLMYCLQGDGNELPVSQVPEEDSLLASKGWYFLMGHMSLTKYRVQKRTAPTPTEDVEIAIAFFMQDLEYSMDNWETWYRLAQAYDTKIEESVIWSAEKLNNSMPEIVQHQRAAIHCYTMATALMHRSADLAFETSDKMTELYSDFATRLYSSSREPFSMLPFALEDEKFLSTPTGMGKSTPFKPMRLFTVWKLARSLYQRAVAGKPRSWTSRFALGKCLWKMHCAPAHVRGRSQKPSAQQVLEAFVRAIELLPDKKDSRERREPTLEPHYKLVVIVHKLLCRGELSLEEAHEALHHSQYARLVTFPQTMDEWVPHVQSVVKNLRAADKSNWHHRMIASAAHLRYDYPSSPGSGYREAKQELTQQMFTKTMVLQVWRPECERAGRHFVYTARYTRFLTQILQQLKDRSNLEVLARRVRRRQHDMFEHNMVWQEICTAYVKLLREHADLSEGLETSTFSTVMHDDFLARKEPLEKWMQAQDWETSPALDVLREVQELKKINQGLMKPAPIDDLIGDAYAYLFSTIGKQLWDDERKAKIEEEARRPPPVASPPRNPMMSLINLMNLDGAADCAAAPTRIADAAVPPGQTEQPAQRKKIGVGRREIRTCAESCVHKAQAAPSTKTLAASNTRVQVVISTGRVAAGNGSGENSAPASIHDSADDESELSELEEDGDAGEDEDETGDGSVVRPLFPGLPSAAEPADASPVSGIADSTDDEDEEIIMEEPEEAMIGS